MSDWRNIKVGARRLLHGRFQVKASYYASATATPRLIHVRVHTKRTEAGDLKGTSFSYAETEEVKLRLVFDRSEVDNPPKNGLVIISADEGYRIGQTEPADTITRTAEVARLTPADIANYILPENLP